MLATAARGPEPDCFYRHDVALRVLHGAGSIGRAPIFGRKPRYRERLPQRVLRRDLGHVPLEAVAEKNANLPPAVNRARFVQEVASGKIQAGNSKIRMIEGIQEFAA